MIYSKNKGTLDIPTKDIEKATDIPNEAIENYGRNDSSHLTVIFMLFFSGIFIFTIGLYNLIYVYSDQFNYGNLMKNCSRNPSCISEITGADSLSWTTSASVMMFGLMAILVAYCSYCAICIKDLGVAVPVLTMQNCLIILQILAICYIDQNRLTWHFILGHLIKNNRILNYFVGFVFIIHAFSWIFSYRLCKNIILEKEQQFDRDVQDLERAKWNKNINLCVLVIVLLAFLLIKIDDIILHTLKYS